MSYIFSASVFTVNISSARLHRSEQSETVLRKSGPPSSAGVATNVVKKNIVLSGQQVLAQHKESVYQPTTRQFAHLC